MVMDGYSSNNPTDTCMEVRVRDIDVSFLVVVVVRRS